MGDIADYYIQRDLERDLPKFETLPVVPSTIVWVGRDGRMWEPYQMGDTHLVNTVHYIERRDGPGWGMELDQARTYRALVQEAIKRRLLPDDYWIMSLQDRVKVGK